MKITNELGKLIQKYYNDGNSATAISKLINISVVTICNYLKSIGITLRDGRKIDDNLGNEIINLYRGGSSLSNISRKINISIATISKYLKSKNIKIINYQNKTKFNEHIFDNIDTEEKAYWLGFIFADGYISKRDNTFELSVGIKDVNHLIKFNTFMEHEKDNVKISTATYNNKSYKRARWSVVNKHLWNTLNNLGCTPKKSLTLKFPELDSLLIKHFIRGYFDGDGCLTIIKKTISPKCTILGTMNFLKSIKIKLDKLNIKNSIVSDKRMKNTYILNISQTDKITMRFLKYLYLNSSIYLDRKFKRFEFFNNSRSVEKLTELLASENGRDCDVDAVVT